MPKPSKYSKGKKLSDEHYKYKLEKYYEKNKTFTEKTYKKLRNTCSDKRLFDSIKREAKKKFKVYPSAHAKAWIKYQYRKRGGKFNRKKPARDLLLFNTSDNNLYINQVETNERKIVERRSDAKEGDLWVHPNTGNLKMKVGDKWITVNNPNELPKINKQKVKKDLTVAFTEKRKKDIKPKKIIIEEKPKISRGQFLYKYKSPQDFYSWQDLAREQINCPHRNKQYIFNSPAYYLKDDLCNSLINTDIKNLRLTEKPNIINPSFFLLHSNKINNIKYSFIECHNWSDDNSVRQELKNVDIKYKYDVYVNFVIEPNKIYYYTFNWNNLNIVKLLQFPVEEEIIKDHFRTIVNLILLMNQQPEIITEEYIPSKIETLQKKYKVQSNIKPRAICWVGKDFTTRVIKLKPKQDDDMLTVSGDKRKLRPHWRRGHWHTVLKGAKRKERKMRWYQPVFVLGNAA